MFSLILVYTLFADGDGKINYALSNCSFDQVSLVFIFIFSFFKHGWYATTSCMVIFYTSVHAVMCKLFVVCLLLTVFFSTINYDAAPG